MRTSSLFAACLVVTACGVEGPLDVQGEGEQSLTAQALPGTLKAESYKAGGEGVGFHDTTSKNLGGAGSSTTGVDLFAQATGGVAVGWIAAGEWLEYDVTVATAAVFTPTARVSSAKTGTKGLHLEVDGVKVSEGTFTSEAGWEAWVDLKLPAFPLGAGAHRLRVVADTASYNFDTLAFTAQALCQARFPGDPGCSGKLYYGAAVEGGQPSKLEGQTGKGITVFRSYFSGDDAASKFVTRANDDVSHGRIPLMSTKLPGTWAQMAAGTYDAWLLERIKALAAVPGPVWLCLHHEPTGDGAAADWVKMQQHARKLIDANSKNIALVGILNGYPFTTKTPEVQNAYNHPVGTGVHVMGFDSYNPWSPTNGKQWQTVDHVLGPATIIQSWGYPTLVGEYGVRSDPKSPGKAAQWMADAYTYAVAHDFVALSYFDSGQNSPDGTWALDGETLPAFTKALGRPETAHP